MTAGKVRTIHVNEAVGDNVKYDLLGRLVESSGLTRKAIVEILTRIKPGTFHQFKLNPEEFIIKVGKIIEEVKAIYKRHPLTNRRLSECNTKFILVLLSMSRFNKQFLTTKN